MPSPTPQSLLDVLSKPRLVALGREIGVSVSPSATKEAQVTLLAGAAPGLPDLLRPLARDELRAACRAHGLDDSGRSRPALMARLLEAADAADASLPVSAFTALPIRRSLPEAGDVVRVRHRVYLVEEVVASPRPGEATRVLLAGLDDDNQGRRLEVLWEIELGARLLHDQHGLGAVSHLDPPRPFAAYLHALRWNVVTATEARLFQAPFRAGIRLFDYQLTPLKKALELPRANLFIADDVGLGKTIEAGLVLQELTLRQQVDFVLVVCPASLCLQWRDEMERRFGLRFEVYNRAFVAQRRQERGFAVNPWTTHNRFILSYPLLRRPEYRDLLVQRLGDRCRKSLLVLDEAHTAAPASASVYAVDSAVTRTVRDDVAPRFENRLFLSATPHNGHSNSFSALLEILDPQRFTRGVPVRPGQLEAVMVRRLKSDLRAFGGTNLPNRQIVEIDLTEEKGRWRASSRGSATGDPAGHPAGPPAGDAFAATPLDLGSGEPLEIELSRMLAEYTDLMRPRQARRAQLVFIHLQKRLLSSVAAFWRTLKLHAENVGPDLADSTPLLFSNSASDDDEYGVDEETSEDAAGAQVAGASRQLPSPAGRARALLDEMLRRAEAGRHQPDAKVRALLAWMRRYQDPRGGWTDRRVLVFTEYGDTLRYLYRQLRAEIDGTVSDDRRILMFHGGLPD
ncbi:MAG TPA: DISARM system SNF2-like helicase DrmD, partial [Thermoanaerobaculia bacterium]|nr:DISARM system SNF2-like helicase DrmD [Thermoanaerobaculia bacterium]